MGRFGKEVTSRPTRVHFLLVCLLVTQVSYIIGVGSESYANPYQFEYIINNVDTCNSSSAVDMLIWVHSGPANWRRRIAMRETWANRKNIPTSANLLTKIVFFLGATKNQAHQRRVEYESGMYKDIVQENYIDDYRNLTYKAMSGLKWISKHCENVGLILKSDDDMLIYLERLSSHLKSAVSGYPAQPLRNTIICDVWVNRKVERAKGMKWSVSESEFSREYYPTYCPGLALLLSPDLVTKLWQQALQTKFFWVDDVFFTGLLVEPLNVTWIQMGSAFHFGGNVLSTNFIRHPREFIFGHVFPYRADLFYYLWKNMS